MTTCDNGGSALTERPQKRARKAVQPKRLREKGVITPELKEKLERRAAREKPAYPYELTVPSKECAHPKCSYLRVDHEDPKSLCRLHRWKKRYGIEE